MIVRRFFKLYQTGLSRYPYTIQAVQSGLLMGVGDVISQTFIERKTFQEIDINRTARFSSIGLVVAGPALRCWYGILNKYIGSRGNKVALKKVLIDQVVFAPTFIIVFLGAIGILQNKTFMEIEQDINANYKDILVTNYYIWPWVQIVNFYYVPLQYQVLLVQSVALFWNTYLSWKTNNRRKLDESR